MNNDQEFETGGVPSVVQETSLQESALVAVEQSRAVQEVQAALVIAKRFPRDTTAAYARIMDACKRPSLAAVSMYSFPRGGETVKGPTIRLMEVIAQNYGNLNFGVTELERKDGKSVMKAHCWDLETNVKSEKTFDVEHWVEVGRKGEKKRKKLTDPRDIYELIANNGSRRLRSCLQNIIPKDITDDAVLACKGTVAKGDGRSLEDRIRELVVRFKGLGVSQEMLEERLGHKIDLTTGEEISDLIPIYNALKDKQAKRGDFFNFPEDSDEEAPKESLKAKANKILAGEANAATVPA